VFVKNKEVSQTDEELIRLYRVEGHLHWVSTLYLRYTSMVYGVCLKYLKDRESARDSVMQLYELLVKDLLVHEVRNFRGWLYVKTRNHCLMELRSRKKMPHEEIGPLLMENGLAEHPEEEVMLYRDTDKLDKCLQSLAEPQQRCIALFYLEEKCYKEISAATGYDYNQVKSHIQNGKRNLKNCIEQHGS
jgi:RNA polymerase sigma factor (sigma-70 family)